MKITLQPTTMLITIDAESTARIWEGSTDEDDHVCAAIVYVRGDLKDSTALLRSVLTAKAPVPATRITIAETDVAEAFDFTRARIVARVLSDHGFHVTSPFDADLDDVERERWNACIQIARTLA